MTAVPAADGLAALQRDVHVAVAALVVDGARGCVDGSGVLGAASVGLGVVGLRHYDRVCVYVEGCCCSVVGGVEGEENGRCGGVRSDGGRGLEFEILRKR